MEENAPILPLPMSAVAEPNMDLEKAADPWNVQWRIDHGLETGP